MTLSSDTRWRVWVDTGGTFTDCVAKDPDGKTLRAKVLSSSALRGTIVQMLSAQQVRINEKWGAPGDFVKGFDFILLGRSHEPISVAGYDVYNRVLTLNAPLNEPSVEQAPFEVRSPDEAPILAARLITQSCPDHVLPPMNLRLATTRGTNALLERKGVAVVLFITKGFADLLKIGTQQRPDIFALEIRKPNPLYATVVEVDERISSDGTVLAEMDLTQAETAAQRLLQQGTDVAAVALMHSYLNPDHEKQLTDMLLRMGFRHVSWSCDVAPFIRIVPRAETTVVDAYIAPVIQDYLSRVESAVQQGDLHVMTSAGGLVKAKQFRAKDSLLSGPAGGVVGASLAGKRSGFEKIIAFDMGGTSTDVARFDGDYEYVFEHEVGDAHLVASALAIESVAAGGGSICSFDGYRLRVGPESAAAQPGPACYGAGGPLTITDVNLLLGRLDRDGFDIPISVDAAESQLQEIIDSIKEHTGKLEVREGLLQGFLDIANERMADVIRRVSVRKGYGAQDYALVAFGGAGGQHACAIAQGLGIQTIIIPEDASLLSAYGLGHAVVERFQEMQVLKTVDDIGARVLEWIKTLTEQAQEAVASEGIPRDEIVVRRSMVNLRFLGQDSILSVEYDQNRTLEELFQEKYRDVFGHLPEGRQIEIESLRVVCSSKSVITLASNNRLSGVDAEPIGLTGACLQGRWQDVPYFRRQEFSAGHRVLGPALIFEQHSVTLIEAHWSCRVDAASSLIIEREATSSS
ncbi:hydantoinase/oxoprolinase family protein [bacterium]|nr:hydantoinase/oxoprolinase family protein [bacterium]